MNLNVLELIPRYLESNITLWVSVLIIYMIIYISQPRSQMKYSAAMYYITGEQSGQQESENMNLETKLQTIGFAATSWEEFVF